MSAFSLGWKSRMSECTTSTLSNHPSVIRMFLSEAQKKRRKEMAGASGGKRGRGMSGWREREAGREPVSVCAVCDKCVCVCRRVQRDVM